MFDEFVKMVSISTISEDEYQKYREGLSLIEENIIDFEFCRISKQTMIERVLRIATAQSLDEIRHYLNNNDSPDTQILLGIVLHYSDNLNIKNYV